MSKLAKVYFEVVGPQQVDEDELIKVFGDIDLETAQELAEEILCKFGYIFEFDEKEKADQLASRFEKIGIEVKWIEC